MTQQKRISHLFWTSIASMILVVLLIIGGCAYHTHKISKLPTREYMEDYYRHVFELLGKHAATWDRYIQANELEKEVYRMELDTIRMELNLELRDRETWRGTNFKYGIFTKL